MSNIRDLIEKSVLFDEHKKLFIFRYKSLSYGDFHRAANQVANGLLSLGIKKGDKVAILLPNCFEFPCTWLAANMIGAVMVPINTRLVADEITYILNHSDAKVLVTNNQHLAVIDSLRNALPSLAVVINVDATHVEERCAGIVSFDSLLEGPEALRGIDIHPDDLAAILYTSGTTGAPKGCMASHDYFVNLAEVESELFQLTPEDIVLTAQPFYYMDPQWNALMVMYRNATLYVAERFSTSRFWDDVRKHDITCFYCIGAMTSFLFNMPATDLDRRHNVRMVQTSGISPHIHREWEERFGAPVYEIYASTEASADIAVTVDMDRKVGTQCIGRPLWNREARIVDHTGRAVEPGEVGEILIKQGRGMMQGYYKDPEATADVYRDGWFHTGDLAYQDSDGDYHYAGRRKDIIRRGGENIAAAFVENIILNHPKVMDAAVIPVPDRIRGEEVKAYVVLKPGATASHAEIAAYCEQNMASFKVPRYYEFRDSLPKTPSERIQKRKLIDEKEDLTVGCYDHAGEQNT